MIVQLRSEHPDYPDLSAGQPYCVIGIKADEYRILNDVGRPFLYPPDIFEVTDSREPWDWVTEFGDDGERYAYPPALNGIGFFEDYFDHKEQQVSIFRHLLNRRLATAA